MVFSSVIQNENDRPVELLDSVGSVFLVLALENLHSHVIDSSVVEDYNSSIGSRFDVDTAVLAEFVVCAAEVIAHGLGCDVETVSYLTDRAVGETVLDAAKVVEGDSFCHDLFEI